LLEGGSFAGALGGKPAMKLDRVSCGDSYYSFGIKRLLA
jgi:hypothetical protein